MSPRQGILQISHMPVHFAAGLATRLHIYRPSTKEVLPEEPEAIASPVSKQYLYLPINGL